MRSAWPGSPEPARGAGEESRASVGEKGASESVCKTHPLGAFRSGGLHAGTLFSHKMLVPHAGRPLREANSVFTQTLVPLSYQVARWFQKADFNWHNPQFRCKRRPWRKITGVPSPRSLQWSVTPPPIVTSFSACRTRTQRATLCVYRKGWARACGISTEA